MDPRMYQALKKGDIASLEILLQEGTVSLDDVTAGKNTALHIMARLGYWKSVIELSNSLTDLLFAANSKGDTPLHCAAHDGQDFVVVVLIRCIKVFNARFNLTSMQNGHGNTPLHEAVRNCHLAAAYELMKADEQLGGVINEFGETALYLAAERGAVDIVDMLLKFPTCYVAGPNRQTALHAAVCRNYEIAELLLKKWPDLSRQVDASKSSPLHYAASIGDHKMVQLLLHHDASTVYFLDEDGLSPIHVAATMGYTRIIRDLIKLCPDAIELTDKMGRNFLHVAIENKRLEVVKYVLKNLALRELVNGPDHDGNTPLHLATLNHNLEIVQLLLADERTNAKATNHKGLTTLDLVSLCANSCIRLRMHKIMVQLVSAGSEFSPQRMDLMKNKYQRKDDEEINRYRALANNLAIVAVLIATVTFAAAFTLPGGYRSDGGPNQGIAILAKESAFKAFLISDAIAMVCSITVTCLLIYTGSLDHDIRLHSISTAMKFMWVALGGMVMAFAMGIYVVVASECQWLAILICFFACSVPFVAWFIAYWPAFDSLDIVKAVRNQGKYEHKTALFKVMDFQMPHRMGVDFRTPDSSNI